MKKSTKVLKAMGLLLSPNTQRYASPRRSEFTCVQLMTMSQYAPLDLLEEYEALFAEQEGGCMRISQFYGPRSSEFAPRTEGEHDAAYELRLLALAFYHAVLEERGE